MDAKRGDWVQIRREVLAPGERAPQVPEDTQQVPLVLWVKGRATRTGMIGESIRIRTVTGRLVEGILEEVHPHYSHDFGDYVDELAMVGPQVRSLLSSESEADPEVGP